MAPQCFNHFDLLPFMKSMLFAAGLGTRLQPLTNDRPKAMVLLKGKPLLQWAIERLIKAGSKDIIVNVHHYADMIESFIQKHQQFGVNIQISDERQAVLETGGGLKKAQWFFEKDQPFLVCNVDILCNTDLQAMYRHHLQTNALATLAVRERSTSRYLLFDQKQHLVAWKNIKTGALKSALSPEKLAAQKTTSLAFSGIHVLSPRIFDHMLKADKFSIIEVYLKAMQTDVIYGYRHDEDYWIDVGKPASLNAAALEAESKYL